MKKKVLRKRLIRNGIFVAKETEICQHHSLFVNLCNIMGLISQPSSSVPNEFLHTAPF